MKACRIEIMFGEPGRHDGRVDRILANVSDEIGVPCGDFSEELRMQILKRFTERFNLAWEYMARRDAESDENDIDLKLAQEIDGPNADWGESGEESDIDWGPDPLSPVTNEAKQRYERIQLMITRADPDFWLDEIEGGGLKIWHVRFRQFPKKFPNS